MGDNLGQAISQMVAEKLDAEFVEKEIATRVEKLVKESVEGALRSYSKTGELIKKSVEEALRVDRLDLPSYGATVAAILKTQIEATVAPLVAGQLARDMDELLKLAPKEVKLSEITEEMLQSHKDDGDYGEVITVIVEHSEYGGAWIYLDDDHVWEDSDKYRCPYRIGVNADGAIFSTTIGGVDTKKHQHLGSSFGLDQKLRAYIACGTKLIIDEDHVVISVGDY